MLSVAKQLSDIFVKRKLMKNVIYQNIRTMNKSSRSANIVEEKKVNVDGVNINYVRTGKGDHVLFLLPGMMGSIWTDFKPQIEYLDNERLTIIAWDPPGYGKSRPPNRTFSKDFYERDSTMACNFMKTLGYDKFSTMGWSDGGVTCLVFASMYPENVQNIIAITPHAYIVPAVMKKIEDLRDINNWAERYRISTLAVYGEKYFQDSINMWLDVMWYCFKEKNGDLCKGHLSQIKCPSFITFGGKDPLVPREQVEYIQANVKNSLTITFQDSAHDPHLRHPDEFNTLVHEFLLNKDKIIPKPRLKL